MSSSLRHFYLRLGKIFQDWGDFKEFRDEKVAQIGIMEWWNTGKPAGNNGVASLGSRALRERRQEYRSFLLHKATKLTKGSRDKVDKSRNQQEVAGNGRTEIKQ
jgi:hypothetical protein